MSDSKNVTDKNEHDGNKGFLAKFGKTMVENGYQIIPLLPGKKMPSIENWTKVRATKATIDDWVANGFRMSGVGILTKHTPAIDVDVRDDGVAKKMFEFIKNRFGKDVPFRVGNAPKGLFLFRTDTPFRKMRSTKYIDEFGDFHQIEILGDGQQFAAYHVHPDTRKPYHWPNAGRDPISVDSAQLVSITEAEAQEVIDHFEQLAKKEAWEVKSQSRQNANGDIDLDNPFIEDTAVITIEADELRTRLMLVPNEDYDIWFQVGMSLHHQFNGDEEGLKLWHEWSETADDYNAEELDEKWETFDVIGKKRAPITARYILRLSQEAVAESTAALGLKLRTAFIDAKTVGEWEKARNLAREAEIDGLSRSALAGIAKQRRDEITGTKTSLVEIKKALAYMPKKAEKTPKWASPWTYDVSDDRFFSMDTKISTTQQGFNAMFDRQAMTKKDVLDGKHSPSSTASSLALNLYRIPTVAGRRYEPGRDAIFNDPDGTFVNTYPEHEIPPRPEKLLPRDKRNIERFHAHIAHLLADPDEQRMLLDWLSWVVQNPGKHVNYAVLLQGVEGDGKTFFAELMRAVMGVSNVTMLNAHILHSDFTDWAEGQCLACVEEVRLINDKNKYEVLNRIKPYITNTINEIHPKGKPIRNVRNTTSYLLFSNYKDALPIDDNSRRYLILFSQWQNREALAKFKAEDPHYYVRLYKVIEESAAALRAHLLDHEQDDSFQPSGDAPRTYARDQMVLRAKPEPTRELERIVQENTNPLISAELVEVGALGDALLDAGMDVPPAKTLAMQLQRAGYDELGRVRIGVERYRFWSKTPELFQYSTSVGPMTDTMRVKKFVEARRASVADDEY